jgi:hypothetical protein
MQSIQIPLTRTQLEQKRQQAAANGIVLQGDSGEAEAQGVKIGYSYDGALLTITVLHKPWIYPESAVEAKIDEWLA